MSKSNSVTENQSLVLKNLSHVIINLSLVTENLNSVAENSPSRTQEFRLMSSPLSLVLSSPES